jgi:hypothetical protein
MRGEAADGCSGDQAAARRFRGIEVPHSPARLLVTPRTSFEPRAQQTRRFSAPVITDSIFMTQTLKLFALSNSLLLCW